MTRTIRRFGLLLAAVLVVLLVAITVSAAASPRIALKAASPTCTLGKSVKVTATVTGGTAYEVCIYKKVGWSWKKAVTATLVSSGQYTAYVKASTKGVMQLKAGIVGSSGSVTAWSNVVSIKVKG
jgi:uncharacterized protein (DUF58 family)